MTSVCLDYVVTHRRKSHDVAEWMIVNMPARTHTRLNGWDKNNDCTWAVGDTTIRFRFEEDAIIFKLKFR